MPARSGTRRPELLAPRGVGKRDDEAVAYVVGPKPLRHGDHILPPGVEVPDAAEWMRLESWISARRLVPVGPGEPYTTFETFLDDTAYAAQVARVAGSPVQEDDETQE